MRKSAQKQQSQIQTIQRTVTSRNVTQDNGNINNFWKGNRWFCHQCLRIFCYFLGPESRKWLFGKLHLCQSIFKQNSHNWQDVLHSLHALPVAVLTVSANSAARAYHANSAKHIVDSHVLVETCTHLHWHKCENVFKMPLFQRNSMRRNSHLWLFKNTWKPWLFKNTWKPLISYLLHST